MPEMYSFFYNGHEFPGYPDKSPEQFADIYYGALVPWYQIHYRNIESFRRDGQRTAIGLEGNSSVEQDWGTGQYRVTVNGAEVAKDGDTYCPVGEDRVAFYSRTGRRLSAPLPGGWKADEVVGRALLADRSEAVKVSASGGKIAVDVPAMRPMMVFRDGAAEKKAMRE